MKNIVITLMVALGLEFGLVFKSVAQSVYQETNAKAAIGVKFSSLGAGIELATPVTHRSNVRFGFNAFAYTRGLDKDNVHYNAELAYRSIEGHYDFFPFAGGFHISPGFLANLTAPITADASVPAGQSFSLGGADFISDPANPVRGKGKLDFNRVGPSFTVGWGNLLPRSPKRFTVPFEVGFVYQGAPKATLNLAGNVCDPFGAGNCRTTSDPTVQRHVSSEESKINNDINDFQVYPIVSIGFGFKF
jgi:hypothetical protein